MIAVQDPQRIALSVFGISSLQDALPIDPAHHWPMREIAGDFVFLDRQSAHRETTGRDAPLALLGTTWWVFAVAGTGDAWLMKMDAPHELAFLDHDQGPDAVPKAMGIGFAQWLQLADLLRQIEEEEDANGTGLSASVIQQHMDEIQPGLFDRYPFTLGTGTGDA